MRVRIGLVLAGLEAVLVERPTEWARGVELPYRRRSHRLPRPLVWIPLAGISLAIGWALALGSH